MIGKFGREKPIQTPELILETHVSTATLALSNRRRRPVLQHLSSAPDCAVYQDGAKCDVNEKAGDLVLQLIHRRAPISLELGGGGVIIILVKHLSDISRGLAVEILVVVHWEIRSKVANGR